MIHFGICDDNIHYVEFIHQLITQTFMNDQFEYQIHKYTSSQEFLNGFRHYLFDIVLLDIEIDDYDGLALSKILQDSNKEPITIFITSHSSFMKDAYGYNVCKYILKEEVKSILPSTLLSIMKRLTYQQFILSSEEGTIVLSYKDIEYFEYKDRRIYAKYKNQYIQIYISSLKKVTEYIQSSDFIQVNNHFIINLHYIKSMHDGIIKMNYVDIIIPKGKRKHFYQIYQQFILEKYKRV